MWWWWWSIIKLFIVICNYLFIFCIYSNTNKYHARIHTMFFYMKMKKKSTATWFVCEFPFPLVKRYYHHHHHFGHHWMVIHFFSWPFVLWLQLSSSSSLLFIDSFSIFFWVLSFFLVIIYFHRFCLFFFARIKNFFFSYPIAISNTTVICWWWFRIITLEIHVDTNFLSIFTIQNIFVCLYEILVFVGIDFFFIERCTSVECAVIIYNHLVICC